MGEIIDLGDKFAKKRDKTKAVETGEKVIIKLPYNMRNDRLAKQIAFVLAYEDLTNEEKEANAEELLDFYYQFHFPIIGVDNCYHSWLLSPLNDAPISLLRNLKLYGNVFRIFFSPKYWQQIRRQRERDDYWYPCHFFEFLHEIGYIEALKPVSMLSLIKKQRPNKMIRRCMIKDMADAYEVMDRYCNRTLPGFKRFAEEHADRSDT